jgi:putative transposase
MTVASFVASQRACFGVPHVISCRALSISESWFYKWRNRAPTEREVRRSELDQEVAQIFNHSGGNPHTYGSPRIYSELIDAGWKVSEKSVARSMARQGLVARPKRRFRSLTRPDKAADPIPDLVNRQFTAEAPDEKWCGDLTEIPTDEGKLYLAIVIDLAARRIPGFALGEHHDAELASGALKMAAAVRGGDVDGVIFHSDKGSEYTAWLFEQVCERLGVKQSMGRVGSCFDKALVSYCTSCRWLGQSTLVESPPHAFDQSGVAGRRRLEKRNVLVVGLVRDEKAGAMPCLDSRLAHSEALSHFGNGEQASCAESLEVARETVAAA